MIVASEEVLKPAHVRPVEEENERDVAYDAFVHDAGHDSANLDALGEPLHAELIPAPAAMVSDKVRGGVVQQGVLLCQDLLFLLEGSDDRLASHCLVEVAVNG